MIILLQKYMKRESSLQNCAVNKIFTVFFFKRTNQKQKKASNVDCSGCVTVFI